MMKLLRVLFLAMLVAAQPAFAADVTVGNPSSGGKYQIYTNNAGTITNNLVISAAGNVGIGVPTPGFKFDVETDGSNLGAFIGAYGGTSSLLGQTTNGSRSSPTALNSGDSLFSIKALGHDGTSANFGSELVFTATQNWTGSAHGTAMRFFTTPNGSTTIGEKMRLTGDGKLGVGTTTPAATVDVVGPATVSGNLGVGTLTPSQKVEVSDTGNISVYANTTSGGSYAQFEAFTPGGALPYLRAAPTASVLGSAGTEPIHFDVNNATVMTATSNGFVGIGTASPSYHLDVEDNTAGIPVIYGQQNSGTGRGIVVSSAGAEAAFFQSAVPGYTETIQNVNNPLNPPFGHAAGLFINMPNDTAPTVAITIADGNGGLNLNKSTTAGTWTMTFPPDAGAKGKVMQTDGSGVTTWQSKVETGAKSSATDGCFDGEMSQDGSFLYICTVPGGPGAATWMKSALLAAP